ncbi:MAG: circularly permuted type 2 ATP-grasp protein [Bryobacterales bacterium]|nr:circularly permuted type 2 ATP-grasp protein [Bryobacterales bacterium]
MTLLDEVVARSHKLLESPPFQDGAWAHSIQQTMAAHNLAPGGRPVCPVLRPHFVTRRQYENLAKAAESLYSAIDRIRQLALTTPTVMARFEMLPAEKMLANIDPGYPYLAVTSLLDTALHNGTFRFVECSADAPPGVMYADRLADIFYDSALVKELRKKFKLTKTNSRKKLLSGMLAAYKATGRRNTPHIAIVETRPPFKNSQSPEAMLLSEFFRQSGYATEVVTPEQLEYRNGVLTRGDFTIDIVYRRVSAQEFLVRFDLTHPLVRAYREGAICMVNSFRTELVQKKAIFGLLTDETITAGFPPAERKAIKEHIPWTRVVKTGKTTYQNQTVDLLDFVSQHRDRLVLKPNDPSSDLHSYTGSELNAAAWDRALKMAVRNPYVVQEKVDPAQAPFPVMQFGRMDIRPMRVEVHPHIFLGKVEGCSSEISDASSTFSTLSGLAPTLILESNS